MLSYSVTRRVRARNVDQHLLETHAVGASRLVLAAEVVYPEDVIVPGREHGSGELESECLVHDVRQR